MTFRNMLKVIPVAGHSSRSVYGMTCLRSLGRWDYGFELYSGHGCFVCSVFGLACVQVAVLRQADQITHPRSPIVCEKRLRN
jgi:hypothetical protein